MHFYRKHTIRWLAGFLLLLGMTAHFIVPLSSTAQKNALAQWLDRNVVPNGEEQEIDLRNHIRQLPIKSESFDLFLKEASSLVVANQSDFKFTLEKIPEDGREAGIALFNQWSMHQEHSAGNDGLLPESVHNTPKWIAQQISFTPGSIPVTGFLRHYSKHFTQVTLYVIQQLPIPFLSGVSINAP